jgi:hypothetical protein
MGHINVLADSREELLEKTQSHKNFGKGNFGINCCIFIKIYNLKSKIFKNGRNNYGQPKRFANYATSSRFS